MDVLFNSHFHGIATTATTKLLTETIELSQLVQSIQATAESEKRLIVCADICHSSPLFHKIYIQKRNFFSHLYLKDRRNCCCYTRVHNHHHQSRFVFILKVFFLHSLGRKLIQWFDVSGLKRKKRGKRKWRNEEGKEEGDRFCRRVTQLYLSIISSIC